MRRSRIYRSLAPHGHPDPRWFAGNETFGNATDLLLVPDHYVFLMLYSQGVALEDLGVRHNSVDPRAAWRLFAKRYWLSRGTPARMWLDWVFAEVFGMGVQLCAETSVSISTRSPKCCAPTASPRIIRSIQPRSARDDAKPH